MTPQRVTLWFATVLSGLSAGFFFAYQFSVTRGLAEIDDRAYIDTFQAINRTVINPWFAIVFFGAIGAIVSALIANWRADRPVRFLVAAAAVLYVLGAAVTGAGNVPLNETLAGYTDPTPAAAAHARADFETDWNRYNLIRTTAFTSSFGCIVLAALTTRERRR